MAWLMLLAYQAVVFAAASSMSPLQIVKEHLINTDYDRGTHPNDGVNHTLVLVDIHVESFGKIEEVDMEFGAYLYFRQEWDDPRLANVVNKTVILPREDAHLFWRPDTYSYHFRQTDMDKEDKSMHVFLRLHPSGHLYYSRSTHLVTACDMDLRNFPMDTQNCSLTFGSYGHSSRDIDFMWNRRRMIVVEKHEMAQFSVASVKALRRVDVYNKESYSILVASFLLERRIGYYMIQLYLPCIFLVMLSWIVFWMSPDNGGDRLTVGITCILTIVFLLGYINGMLPKVSYVKGVDWYLITSFLFIFLSLVECVLVQRLAEEKKKEQMKQEGIDNEGLSSSSRLSLSKVDPRFSQEAKTVNLSGDFAKSSVKGIVQVLPLPTTVPHGDTTPNDDGFKASKRNNSFLQYLKGKLILPRMKERTLPVKIDFASRILFPLSFALYNAVYWQVYLQGIDVLA